MSENIKKLYKSYGKRDDQQKYKSIIEASTLSTTEGLTENGTITTGTSGNMKNPSARNPLSQVLALLYAKQKLLSMD